MQENIGVGIMINEESMAIQIYEYVKESGAEGVVIGVSGGVDSAVVYKLCKMAQKYADFAFNHVLSVYMPNREDDSKTIIELTGGEYINCPITDIYKSYQDALPEMTKIAKGNLQARIRMSMLYVYANNNNLLVAGTSNKSELELGYFTKYGDGGVDFEPMGDLYKHEVYELAKKLHVPMTIIKRAPSAGLWEGQTDEEELGYSYDVIDDILMRKEKNKHKLEMPPILKRR